METVPMHRKDVYHANQSMKHPAHIKTVAHGNVTQPLPSTRHREDAFGFSDHPLSSQQSQPKHRAPSSDNITQPPRMKYSTKYVPSNAQPRYCLQPPQQPPQYHPQLPLRWDPTHILSQCEDCHGHYRDPHCTWDDEQGLNYLSIAAAQVEFGKAPISYERSRVASQNFSDNNYVPNISPHTIAKQTGDSPPPLVQSRTDSSISSSPGPLTPPSNDVRPPKRKYDQFMSPPLDTQPFYYDKINKEQELLLRKDPRVKSQLEWFKRVRDTQGKTYYGASAPVGVHILEEGSPAQTSASPPEADFLVGNSKDLEQWLVNGSGDKLFLLKDEDWFQTRPRVLGSTILHDLRATTTSKELMIEVQHLGKEMEENKNSVESMHIDEVMQRFAAHDQTRAPINLLSLMCRDDGTVPWPLAKHCNLLNKAAASAASTTQSSYGATATASKQVTEVMSRFIDLQSCIHFMIYGQAGAISSWHIDSIGPYTWVTLEPNIEDQPAEDVLKLWAYVRTDNLSSAERAEIRAEFKETGLSYQPDPKHIKIIALTAGDTLIMPPGTIHAPITITDCLFRGGMVMQKKEMHRSMREWRFCSDNDICTNENQPRQSRAILDYFRQLVKADPASCGYPQGFKEFEADCKEISDNSMRCKCSTGCKRGRCGCASNTQRCGGKCHRGIPRCDNPYGCDVDVL
ncbi:hypothetical protein B0O99DRAFT_693126 [Bisporella sp. PMI_857]|nr:hypothetical protein B0O99DRAFT_693126 [Bisporella sp. PMI_857]